MPPRIVPILERLRQDISGCLTKKAIEDTCRQSGYSWRNRLLDPVTTIYLFLLQILHGNTSCQHVVHFGCWTFSDSAYCQARKRLPLGIFYNLLERVTATFRKATAGSSQWLGHRVWVLDNSSFSMSDTPALQAAFGQPTGQRPGCGFPVAKWLALMDLATGMLLRSSTAPLRSHEMARCGAISDDLEAGDIVMGDRAFCSYAHFAILVGRSLHGVFRAHQKQIIDFTPGRPQARLGPFKNPAGLPHSRWVRAQGDADQIVVWYKPKRNPKWMSQEEYAALPEEITVRELRYRVESPGFRTGEVTVVTTLLDATVYPASALADLYFRRWMVEVNFKHLKITMNMDVLNCKTVDGVLKELAIFALAYNLVRSVMVESARAQGVTPERVSLIDAVRWLIGSEEEADITDMKVNPHRPGRAEPRVKKRRPKQYRRMTKPRSVLRKELLDEGVAA
jgi:hypothetical protein